MLVRHPDLVPAEVGTVFVEPVDLVAPQLVLHTQELNLSVQLST